MGGSGRRRATPDLVRRIALELPDTSEKLCFGTPAFYVKKTLFARLLDDGDSVVVKMPFEQRDAAVESLPEVFAVTPHYQAYPMVIVRLGAVAEPLLRDVLLGAWTMSAPVKRGRASPGPSGARRRSSRPAR